MKDLIIIKICVGTYSYLMGGAQLMNLKDELPQEWQQKIKTEAVISLPECNENIDKPPYVLIDNELMTEANIEKIKEKLKLLLA
jgi:iron-hydrogenase subunit alpha